MLSEDGATGGLKVIIVRHIEATVRHDAQIRSRAMQQNNDGGIFEDCFQRREVVQAQGVNHETFMLNRQLQ